MIFEFLIAYQHASGTEIVELIRDQPVQGVGRQPQPIRRRCSRRHGDSELGKAGYS
jgi:hypothetical protein